MAQNITLQGASYSDVPSVVLPKTGGGTASFTDVTSTTAGASDVASGKYFFTAEGVLTLGTSSGGGGGSVTQDSNGFIVLPETGGGGGGATLKVGALRPDAELVQSWTYDKLIVADEGLTIPAYTTSSTTLLSSSIIESGYELDIQNYDYILVHYGISKPVYSSSALGSGRQEYHVFAAANEIGCVASGSMKAANGSTGIYYSLQNVAYPNFGSILYWSSSSRLEQGNASYGVFQTFTSPSSSSSAYGSYSIDVKSPIFYIRGNATYLTSTYWSYLTDVRYQYALKLYKVPRTGDVVGFGVTSSAMHAISCANSASGDLT